MKKTIVKTAWIGLFLAAFLSAYAQTNNTIHYFYDDLGRLVKVVDPSGNVATYSYDAVGNILKITRSTIGSQTSLAILNFTPSQGGVGTRVTIQGQGFSPTAALNTVFFNGTAATVVSATASSIVTTVPVGASTGPISVTVNGQTANSDNSFIFVPSPAILSVSPKFVLTSSSPTQLSNFVVTGVALNSATFTFQPTTVPPTITITSVTADPSGASASLSLSIAANAAGAFNLVATNGSGSSSQVPSPANTLHVISPNGDDDGDGLTNAVEIALGTDPLNASTVNDGISDGWKVFYGLNPLDPTVASQDPDGDGFTNLQEFQQGTDPRNPDTVAPAVSQVFPAGGSTVVPANSKVIIRFTEPLLSGVGLAAVQNVIDAAVPSLPLPTRITAAQTLQAFLQNTCCGNSVLPGVVTLSQAGTTIGGTAQLSNDGLSLTFSPAQQLAATTSYTVQVNGVRDLAGNRMTQQFTSTFTTGQNIDTNPPVVLQTSPVNGATGAPTNTAFTLQFSKRIDPGTLTPVSFTITDNTNGQNVGGMVQVDPSGLTAAFVPNPPLGVGRTFIVRLNSSLIKDTSGNSLSGSTAFSFATAFTPDNDVPHLVASSPASGDTAVLINSIVDLQFNEPLNIVSASTGVSVTIGGQPVAGSIALSDSNRRITFTPASVLSPNTIYTVTVSPAIEDLANRLIDNPGSFTFTTGNAVDTSRPQVVQVSPADGVISVPVNALPQIQFNKRIDPLTVTSATFLVFPNGANQIPGIITVSANGLTATFTPSSPLVTETRYFIRATGGITDLAGQSINFFQTSFVTGTGTQANGPQVTSVSPQNGSLGVQVNARVDVQLSTPVDIISVNSNSIVVSANGVPVTGTTTVNSDHTIITFTPAALLAVNTVYTVAVAGFTDVAGNVVTSFNSSFTTGTSGVADKAALVVSSVVPANNSTGVPVNSSVVLTFNKAVDATTASPNSIQVKINGNIVAGSYVVNGNTVSFTPATPFLGNTQVTVQVFGSLLDAAGNGANFFSSVFTTGAGTDTTAPQVISVTPNDQATNIGQNTFVVLTFSKSLNPATVNGNNFALLAGSGLSLASGTSISADNRTVTLSTGTLPASSVVTVVATSGVRDLAGNALSDFRSQFTTAAAFDTAHASVVSQRPGNGASGVPLTSSVVVYVNEPLNTSTIANAFHVSQNGVLAQGTVNVRDNGQTLEFVPAAPWANNALIQVFLDSTALDVDGAAVNAYQGSFRTVPDTTTTTPSLVNTSPVNGASGIALNAVVEWQYNEPLNPNTVNTNTVLLQNGNTGQFVAGTVSLDASGTLIRFVPTVPLAGNVRYFPETTQALQGTNGLTQGFTTFVSFVTGTTTDTVPPMVTLVSPPDGFTGVPVNGDIHVRFNEPINPLTVNAQTIQVSGGGQTVVASSLSFANNNQEVVLTPQEPFAENTGMTITISGVEDLAGNRVLVKSTQFTTGAGPATGPAAVIQRNPFDGATNVPPNTVIALQTNFPVDPGSVNSNTFVVRDNVTFQNVAGNYSVSADGLTVSFVPNAPLPVGRSHSVFFTNGITDLAGNVIGCAVLCNFSFTTGTAADGTAPLVQGISPSDQLTGVPINTQVVVQFNEPLNALSLGQVVLSSGGTTVKTIPVLANAQTTLILTPVVPLTAGTQYQISVAGVQDLSGNVLAAPVTTTFTTGAGADLVRPQVVQVSPADGVISVPVNALPQIQFNKRIDPLTVTSATFQVFPSGGNPIPGTISVSADGLTATFTPAQPLSTSTRYFIRATGGITDLPGQGSNFFQTSFVTGTGALVNGPQVTVVSPQSGSTGVPVNVRIDVQLNTPVDSISVNSTSVVVSAGGSSVTGTTTVSSDRTVITFVPSALLAVNTTYTVTVSGFTDVAGNVVTPFSSTFTTGASGIADKTALVVSSVNPANNTTGVPVNSSVVLTFNKLVDGATANTNSIPVRVNGVNLGGTYAVNGNTVSFTPVTPFPGNTQVQVQVVGSLLDVAGNGANFFSSVFTTGVGTDTTPPQVVSITPNGGASNIGLTAPIVLTFSKALNPATVNTNTFGVFGAGSQIGLNTAISADNRTVSLNTGNLPASSVVTVLVTSGVKDIAGNSLADFRSTFTTTAAPDTTHASVVGQRPGNGAAGVPLNTSVVLFVNEPLSVATVANAVHLSQNGNLAPGAVTTRDNGQTIEFVPASPWQNNALVQVLLDGTALDTEGATVNSYQGSFRTVPDATNTTPSLVSISPVNGATGIAENAIVDQLYNEPLDPTSVNTSTVVLVNNSTGQNVAGTVTLSPDGFRIRFVPSAPLTANIRYFAETTSAIKGVNGLVQGFTTFNSFVTGTATDTAPPVVTLISPPDGFANVPVNGDVHVRFNEPINPLTVNAQTIQVSGGGQTAIASSISFANNNQEVVLTPQEPFPDNTPMTITVSGVEDLAANQVVVKTTQFTTGAGPATGPAAVVRRNPFDGASNVATNSVISLQTNMPVDPGSVNSNTFLVRDNITFQPVVGIYSVSADGFTVSFTPNSPLPVTRSHSVFFTNGMTDLAGNVFGCAVLCNFSFVTGTAADTTGPLVTGVSPTDQLTGVPINSQVLIQFNKPVNQLTLSQVTLTSGGNVVSTIPVLTNGQTTLILMPVVPLTAATTYQVNVAGVQDLSGNQLGVTVTTGFTTGAGADLLRPQVAQVTPANGASGVSTTVLPQVQFNKRIDPLTVTSATFQVFPSGGNPIPGTISVSADGLTATFTPTVPLNVSTRYSIQATGGITDLAGQSLSFFSSSFTTAAQ